MNVNIVFQFVRRIKVLDVLHELYLLLVLNCTFINIKNDIFLFSVIHYTYMIYCNYYLVPLTNYLFSNQSILSEIK